MKTVFLSSTFRDMHFERDLIHESVSPQINRTAAQYGDHVSFCDLRWGINTLSMDEDESSRKVLRVCFDEIDRCRPYMIVFIGSRYGWIPEEDLIQSSIEGRDLVLEDLERSVTELEIEYGALSRLSGGDSAAPVHVFFYFRHIEGAPPPVYRCEDDLHEAKLNALKARIERLAGGRLREYTVRWDENEQKLLGEETLGDMIRQDLLSDFSPEWEAEKNLSPLQRTLRTQLSIARQKDFPTSRRTRLIDEYLSATAEESAIVIQGESGCGKSVLMSAMVHTLLKDGHDVLPVFSGSTLETNDASDLARLCIRFLEERLGVRPQDSFENFEAMRLRLIELGARYSETAHKELYICIDALDQLFPDETRDKLLFLIPEPGAHIHYILSALSSHPINAPIRTFTVPPVAKDEQALIVQGILEDHRRELDPAVIQALTAKTSAASPLYTGMLLTRLMMLRRDDFEAIHDMGDGMENISLYQQRLVQSFPNQPDAAVIDLIHAASERVGGSLVQKALAYLAFSRHGLRQEDLFSLFSADGLNFSGLDFSLFVQYLSDFFLVRDDGRYDFTHVRIRESIFRYFANARDACLQNIFSLLLSLPEDDPVRILELGYHAMAGGHPETVYQLAVSGSEAAKDALSKDVREFSLSDHGAFIIRLNQQTVNRPDRIHFMKFVIFRLLTEFALSRSETQIRSHIIDQILLTIDPASPIAAEFFISAAECCMILASKENLARARQYYDLAIPIYDRLYSQTANVKVLDAYLYALAKSSENDVHDGKQERAYETASRGLALSEKTGNRNYLTLFYTNAVSSLYFIGSTKKFVEKKPLFGLIGKHEGEEELQKAVALAQKGDTVLERLYQNGRFNERGLIHFAQFKHIYADAVESLLGPENMKKARQIYLRAAEIGLDPRNTWNIENATLRAQLYGALTTSIIDSEDWASFDEAISYTEKALSISRFVYRQTQTVESEQRMVSSICSLAQLYLAKKTEPEEGFLESLIDEAVDRSERLAQQYPGSGSISSLARSYHLRATFGTCLGDISAMHYLAKSKQLFPAIAATQSKFFLKAWKNLKG